MSASSAYRHYKGIKIAIFYGNCLALSLLVSNLALAVTGTTTTNPLNKNRQSWGLDIESGLKLDRGNTERTSSDNSFSAFRRTKNIGTHLNAEYLFGRTDKKRFKNKAGASLRADYHLDSDWRVFAFTAQSFDEFLNLTHRASYGVGPWLDLHFGKLYIAPSFALTYSVENFRDFSGERLMRGSFRVITKWTFSERSSLGFDFFYIPAFENFDDYHLSFKPYLMSKLIGDMLALKTRLDIVRDNAPKPGIKKTDISLVSSIVLSLKP